MNILEAFASLDVITTWGAIVGIAAGCDDIDVSDIGAAMNILDDYRIRYYWPGYSGQYRLQVSAKDSGRARAVLGALVVG